MYYVVRIFSDSFLCILAYLRNKKFDEEEKNKEDKEQELVDK